jgi:hypothetical protein
LTPASFRDEAPARRSSLRAVSLELTPGLAALDEAALRKALATARLRLDPRPEAAVNAWALAALREAVENEPASPRQALSPRSTRGATRA